MKKSGLIILLLLLIGFTLRAQSNASYRILIDDQQVPKEVIAKFKALYPKPILSLWYSSHITYWYEDYAPGWYGTWYPSRQVVIHRFEKPSYYEVDFDLNGEPSRAIFSRYGQWFETRTKIKKLPDEVLIGLSETEYADWTRSDHKERIQIPGIKEPIYRLKISRDDSSYILRLSDTGEIVQVKYE